MKKHVIFGLTAFLLMMQTVDSEGVPASYPAWWIEYGIIDEQGDHQNNSATVNQGQAKYFTQQAIQYLDDRLKLIGGATFVLGDSLTQDSPNHHAPLNIGQLKNLTSRFYLRFSAIGFQPGDTGWPATLILDAGTGDTALQYPWLTDVEADNHKSANLGQIKHLFSWQLDTWITEDADQDGIPDYWEQLIYNHDTQDALTSHTDVLPGDDYDGDGLTNIEEFLAGTNPTLVNSGAGGSFQIHTPLETP